MYLGITRVNAAFGKRQCRRTSCEPHNHVVHLMKLGEEAILVYNLNQKFAQRHCRARTQLQRGENPWVSRCRGKPQDWGVSPSVNTALSAWMTVAVPPRIQR